MSTLSPAFVAGFVTKCREQGMPVKAAAALLWRAEMKDAETPSFLEGVKRGCQNAVIPPVPEAVLPDRPRLDREPIKAARAVLADLDLCVATHDGFLKQAFVRRRNTLQRNLNAYIMGEPSDL